MSDELIALVRRMMGESKADRELAIERALDRSPDERGRMVQALYEQLRRAENVARPVEALVAFAGADSELADEIAERIGALDRRHFEPAIAVMIATSSVSCLGKLAGQLAADEAIPPDTRQALKEVLE